MFFNLLRKDVEEVNKLVEFGKKIWKNMPPIGKKILIIVSMFLAGELFPWEIVGEFGSYIRAGLILGAILLIVKLFDDSKEKGKKKENPKITKLKKQIRIDEEKIKKLKKKEANKKNNKKLGSLCNND